MMVAQQDCTFRAWAFSVQERLPVNDRVSRATLDTAVIKNERAQALASQDPVMSQQLHDEAVRIVRIASFTGDLRRLRGLKNQTAEVVNCIHLARTFFREQEIDEALRWLDQAREQAVWPPSR